MIWRDPLDPLTLTAPPNFFQKTADVWKKDVWDFQAFSQTFFELRFSLGNEGKGGRNLNSQTWPETPRRPSPRHPRPADFFLSKNPEGPKIKKIRDFDRD